MELLELNYLIVRHTMVQEMHRLSRYIVGEVCAIADYVPVPYAMQWTPVEREIIASSRTFLFSPVMMVDCCQPYSWCTYHRVRHAVVPSHRLAVAPHASLGRRGSAGLDEELHLPTRPDWLLQKQL